MSWRRSERSSQTTRTLLDHPQTRSAKDQHRHRAIPLVDGWLQDEHHRRERHPGCDKYGQLAGISWQLPSGIPPTRPGYRTSAVASATRAVTGYASQCRASRPSDPNFMSHVGMLRCPTGSDGVGRSNRTSNARLTRILPLLGTRRATPPVLHGTWTTARRSQRRCSKPPPGMNNGACCAPTQRVPRPWARPMPTLLPTGTGGHGQLASLEPLLRLEQGGTWRLVARGATPSRYRHRRPARVFEGFRCPAPAEETPESGRRVSSMACASAPVRRHCAP